MDDPKMDANELIGFIVELPFEKQPEHLKEDKITWEYFIILNAAEMDNINWFSGYCFTGDYCKHSRFDESNRSVYKGDLKRTSTVLHAANFGEIVGYDATYTPEYKDTKTRLDAVENDYQSLDCVRLLMRGINQSTECLAILGEHLAGQQHQLHQEMKIIEKRSWMESEGADDE